jgi:hypothetical protein
MKSIKVRLTAELTRYSPGLVIGAMGQTAAFGGIWSPASDRFVAVTFPGIGTYDILWESLEIIDAEYLAEAANRKKERNNALRSARNVVRTVGPRGGFKYLSYEYSGNDGVPQHVSTSFKADAEELLEIFRGYGIAIEERKL